MCHFYGNKRDAPQLEKAHSALNRQRTSETQKISCRVNADWEEAPKTQSESRTRLVSQESYGNVVRNWTTQFLTRFAWNECLLCAEVSRDKHNPYRMCRLEIAIANSN